MPMDNDVRGWVLTSISALACVLGASVICIDLVIRLLPGKKGFRIQDNDAFLSCSLSLSAGVMLFSALYKMLPSSKKSLHDGGLSKKSSEWILIGCFLLGVFGIQILSNIIHRFMPSNVVDCEHTHGDEEDQQDQHANHHQSHNHNHDHEHHSHDHDHNRGHGAAQPAEHKPTSNGHGDTERTPLLTRSGSMDGTVTGHFGPRQVDDVSKVSPMPLGAYSKLPSAATRPAMQSRPSIQARTLSSVKKIVSGSKLSCDGDGPCYGYSDPCGQECFKNINSRGGIRSALSGHFRPSMLRRSQTAGVADVSRRHSTEALPSIEESMNHISNHHLPQQQPHKPSEATSIPANNSNTAPPRPRSTGSISGAASLHSNQQDHNEDAGTDSPSQRGPQHHHHVPQNAFLALSLQTSIAIALHKLPEGFITYATNHANPSLGLTVFLALAIHNISEGFALALPLFLATQSRLKALVYACILGGLSQPLGAGVAAIWLKLAERGRGEWTPGERVYGGMFAATAGIMASVGLSLLQESLELSHRKALCMAFAFVGMGVLGVSSALTA